MPHVVAATARFSALLSVWAFLFLFLSVLSPLRGAEGLGFSLEHSMLRCFTHDVSAGALVHGLVHILNSGDPLSGRAAASAAAAAADTQPTSPPSPVAPPANTSPLQLHFQVRDASDNVVYDAPDVQGTSQYSFTTPKRSQDPPSSGPDYSSDDPSAEGGDSLEMKCVFDPCPCSLRPSLPVP
jgi:hypothetical protein